jgi:hypothetical protein
MHGGSTLSTYQHVKLNQRLLDIKTGEDISQSSRQNRFSVQTIYCFPGRRHLLRRPTLEMRVF